MPRKALPPPQLGSPADCVCSHLLRPPLPACPYPQGHRCPPSTPLRCASAHKSGVSKHDHRHITTGTKLCHWHLGTRSEAGCNTAVSSQVLTRLSLIRPTTSWSCREHRYHAQRHLLGLPLMLSRRHARVEGHTQTHAQTTQGSKHKYRHVQYHRQKPGGPLYTSDEYF